MSLLEKLNTVKKIEEEKQQAEPESKAGTAVFGESNKTSDAPISKEQELMLKLQKKIMYEAKGDQDVKSIIPKIDSIAQKILETEEESFETVDTKKVVQDLINDVTGYGPINPLLLDPEVTEVMVNGPYKVYVEKHGKIKLTTIKFRDNDQVMNVIDKIVSPLGRRIDESSPMVDARLPDGSRVNAIIPPLALNGPSITIRKFSKDPYTIENLIEFGTVTSDMAQFLDACVKAKLNVFISGGTGSGKTTTLNVLSGFIPNDERIVTIEDSAELQLSQDHVVSLEARPANMEGKGAVTIRNLVKNSLRMRPDRIVIGEVRGEEALDMLQAMNTGHDGSLPTGHANSPRDMLSRLETMVLMAGMNLPDKAIREQIAAAMNLIVHESRFPDGTRKITALTEIQGMEGDIITLQDIFVYEQKGKDENGRVIGRFRPTGIRPKFMDKLMNSGIQVSNDIFWDKQRV